MNDFRELLLGCGHSRVKKMPSVDGNPNWRGLTTLDLNHQCGPDLVCNLDQIFTTNESWICAIPERPCEAIFIEPEKRGMLRGNYWDEVHAYEVLEHLGQQGYHEAFFAHFSEIWRILKPGGHLYATVPSRFSEWLWGDPSHRRVIYPCSLVFLDQAEYIRQLDGPQKTAMSDFRHLYKADFKIVRAEDDRTTFRFILQAVKPSRCAK